jgi:hypothetical protein
VVNQNEITPPADNGLDEAHVDVDHQYVAVARMLAKASYPIISSVNQSERWAAGSCGCWWPVVVLSAYTTARSSYPGRQP